MKYFILIAMIGFLASCGRHIEPSKGFEVCSISDAPHSDRNYKYVLRCEDTSITVFSDREFSIGERVTFCKAEEPKEPTK